jgi:hypothetical protein
MGHGTRRRDRAAVGSDNATPPTTAPNDRTPSSQPPADHQRDRVGGTAQARQGALAQALWPLADPYASHFYHWRAAGIGERIFATLQQTADAEQQLDWSVHFVDSSVVRVHQHAARAKKESASRSARSQSGWLLNQNPRPCDSTLGVCDSLVEVISNVADCATATGQQKPCQQYALFAVRVRARHIPVVFAFNNYPGSSRSRIGYSGSGVIVRAHGVRTFLSIPRIVVRLIPVARASARCESRSQWSVSTIARWWARAVSCVAKVPYRLQSLQ